MVADSSDVEALAVNVGDLIIRRYQWSAPFYVTDVREPAHPALSGSHVIIVGSWYSLKDSHFHPVTRPLTVPALDKFILWNDQESRRLYGLEVTA